MENFNEIIISSFSGAFFAFVFFVIGQYLIRYNEKKDKKLDNLNVIKEFIAMQIPIILLNKKKAKEFNDIDTNKPVQVFIKRFEPFVIDNFFYTKINKYKVLESIVHFWSYLKILDEDMKTLNDTINDLSNFSRIAMIEKKEKNFEETMKINLEDFKEKTKIIYDRIEEIEKTPESIIDEINFYLWYERSYFWNKCYFGFRYKLDKDYRKKMINIIKSKYGK
ncbi:MAG: hypothetical protein BWX82_00602 [Parcubacteria group bacterium ADurb.Bin115]|nr:MAG: hypothetical protein BWX82_00602 [Parcubacteria group bacterium ADurb.Bin115]